MVLLRLDQVVYAGEAWLLLDAYQGEGPPSILSSPSVGTAHSLRRDAWLLRLDDQQRNLL
jgi:hypothetical protein